ncbi:APC family permease [Bacillus sp. BRMEA1]|uniref:APC family permease n=1 Tax=Neobacillus endophyticus TaxID=2738405 RepID=UPI001563B854|nr:APC family permease [Neobacillus endophyticus]NRD80012.1 APC family permease [Neobacillus endophyticus]
MSDLPVNNNNGKPSRPQRLVRNLSVWDAVIMSAGTMGPAVSMYFNTGYAAGFAGAAMPISFFISLIACLILANTIGDFSKLAPSAGAFYTFSSKGFGPRTGFITGWLLFIGYSTLEPAEEALFGITASTLMNTYLHIHISWVLIALASWLVVLVLSWIGAKQSLKLSLILFLAEVGVLLILCMIILVKGGFNGIHASVFNPSLSPTGFSGIALGMVYGILSFVGFEAATTLAEEVREPGKNVYRALIGSTLLVGIIYCFSTFAEVNGFGLANMKALASDPSPFVTLSVKYGNEVLVAFVALAGLSSILAVTINVHNAVARVIYVVGREKILPASVGKVHKKYNTPTNAIIIQSIVSIILLLVMGLSVGPSNTYGYLGALLTLGIIPVYMLAAFGYVRFQARQQGGKRQLFKHFILPIVGALILFIPLIGTLYPVPAAPYNWFPYIIVVYVIVGIIIIQKLAQEPGRLEQVGKILADAESGDNE